MHRRGEAQRVATDFGQCVLGRVLAGQPEHQRRGDQTEDDPAGPERRVGQQSVLVPMGLGGVHHLLGDERSLDVADRRAARVAHPLADGEVLEVVACSGERRDLHRHPNGLRGKSRSEMMRCWIWLVPSKMVVNRASRQCRST